MRIGLQKEGFSDNLKHMKRKITLAAVLLIAGTLALIWMSAGTLKHATPKAAEELEELCTVHLPALAKEDEIDAEMLEPFERVLEDFYQRQDPRYEDPETGIGILDIACIFKKTELARCLLQDGASPNAHHPGDDSPLLLAVGTWFTPQATPQQINALVDTLLEGGADFKKSGYSRTDFLTQAAQVCEREEVILHLMERGAQPDADTSMPLALHGWDKALSQALQKDGNTDGLLHAAAKGAAHFSGRYKECLELVKQHGADVNDTEKDMPGCTPLYLIAREMIYMSEGDPLRPQAIEVISWLLAHGADPYLRSEEDEEYPGFCPYDFLAMNPNLLMELKKHGHELTAPALSFSTGTRLLAEVCREAAAAEPHSAEELLPHYEAIAAVLSPTADMQQQEIYPQALDAAVGLLARADKVRAAQSILSMPLWQGELPPPVSEGEADKLSALVHALQDTPGIALPQDFLCRQAEKLLQSKRPDEAATMIELLERCPDAQETIERYCADPRMPLQAGAYAAKLAAAGLPDARNSGVASWLLSHHRKADTPFLQQAMLLTSLEKLWYGQMQPEQQQEMLQLMRSIGATIAAEAYERIIPKLDAPDELDNLMAQGDDWKYELEAATARFFLEHKDEFTHTTTQP